VRLLLRLSHELDALLAEGPVVAPEIVGLEEEKDSPARLVADAGRLNRSDRPREEQLRPGRARRLDHDPPLGLLRDEPVFDQAEPECADEEPEGLVVVAHDERDEPDRLLHAAVTLRAPPRPRPRDPGRSGRRARPDGGRASRGPTRACRSAAR